MNMNQVINMVIRQVMRRVINKGVSTGIDVASRKFGSKDAPETGAKPNAPDSGATQKRAKQTMRMARRIGRM